MSRSLQQYLESARERWRAEPRCAAALARATPAVQRSLDRVLAGSDFVVDSCIRDPALLEWLVGEGALEQRQTPAELVARLSEQLAVDANPGAASDAALDMQLLRRTRRREMLKIAWRDLAGWAALDETLGSLSTLADNLIAAAVRLARASLLPVYGVPRDADANEQSLIILGMGKLGGGELNFSSDIDLIFAYPEEGETQGAAALSNHEFFIRLGQSLINALNENTADGFVFRVDMRLRPNGASGPLALSFGARPYA